VGWGVTVLVDSSVWIAFLRNFGGPELELLEQLIGEQRAATTDVVLLEVLAGTTGDERAGRLRRFLPGAELLHRDCDFTMLAAHRPARGWTRQPDGAQSAAEPSTRRASAAELRPGVQATLWSANSRSSSPVSPSTVGRVRATGCGRRHDGTRRRSRRQLLPRAVGEGEPARHLPWRS